MKKNIIRRQSPRQARKASRGPMTIGMDLGDKTSRYCVLDDRGELVGEGSVATTKKAMAEKFGGLDRTRIAMEVGTHSPWVSRLLAALGHEVIVANARRVRLISESSSKDDKLDARMLARLARIDPQLLRPIRHRTEKAQSHRMAIRVRAALVDTRTSLVNTARGLTKAMGERLPACDTDALDVGKLGALPAAMQETLRPLLEQVESLTEKIKQADVQLEQIARIEYPETKLLRQVSGVGVLIALTFVLTVEDCGRFEKSRDVGCYVGLRPKRSESGQSQPQLRITQGRRPVSEKNAGAGSAFNFEPARAGYGSEALGTAAGRARRKESEEASGGGRGQKAGRAAAPVVGDGGSVPAVAQPAVGGVVEFSQRRVRVTARSRRNERIRKRMRLSSAQEMAAPV